MESESLLEQRSLRIAASYPALATDKLEHREG
jgi:hypothetical protein